MGENFFLYVNHSRDRTSESSSDFSGKWSLLIIRNVSWAANQHIRMISCEGSYDTEDWSNDAENSALITGINYVLKYIHIEHDCFKL